MGSIIPIQRWQTSKETFVDQASTLTSVIPPKRMKIWNDGQFSKIVRQKME